MAQAKEEVRVRSAPRWAAACVALLLGGALVPLGCGGSSEGIGPAAMPAHSDGEVPEGVAQQIRACASGREDRLGSAKHSVRFDVTLGSDGRADVVSLERSTLGDPGLEACMASALRSLTAGDLEKRPSENGPRGQVAPESRALLGQGWEEAAVGCLASPPCLLTVGFLIAAAFVVVEVAVQPAQASRPKAKPRPAPTATTMPTAVATTDPRDDELSSCEILRNLCIENPYQPEWNRQQYGKTKDCFSCYRICLREGTWPSDKCPRDWQN